MFLFLIWACQIETPILSDTVAPIEENTAPDPTGDTLSIVSGTADFLMNMSSYQCFAKPSP